MCALVCIQCHLLDTIMIRLIELKINLLLELSLIVNKTIMDQSRKKLYSLYF